MEDLLVATADIFTLRAETADWSLPSRRKIGVISLIVTETALFTIFAVAYLFYIGKSLTGPYPAQVLEPPILATICLLSSSVTIMLAERAFRTGATGSFKFWWLITMVLAVVFLGWTALEWRRLIYQHNLTIATNLFGTSFYSLVGLHATHVVAGGRCPRADALMRGIGHPRRCERCRAHPGVSRSNRLVSRSAAGGENGIGFCRS